MENFRMNRKVVGHSSFEGADDHTTFFINKTPLERLNHACFLINQIFKVESNTKMDRSIINYRKNA